MKLNKVQNEFLGCTSAIAVDSQEQFMKLREWMAIQNLFLQDGTPVTQLNVDVTDKRVAFYRDDLGMFVGHDHPANIGMNYSIKEFKEAFPDTENYEQRSLFGGDEVASIRPPEDDLIVDPMGEDVIDQEVKEVQNELSLVEALNKLEVGSVTPATIAGNVVEFKEVVINAISRYKNIVVNQDNFKELTKTRAELNSKKSAISKNKKSIENEALKEVKKVSDAMTDIIKAIDNVIKPLDNEIKDFESKEKEALKQKLMEKTINPTLDMLLKQKMLDEDTRKEFSFKPAWTNASSFTKTGNLTKKVTDEINAELNRTVELYSQKQKDIETIKSTVEQLALAHKLNAQLNADTYISLYQKGSSMPEVQQRINQDVEMIKNAIQKEVNKKAQETVSNQQKVKELQNHQTNENVSQAKEKQSNVTVLTDEKTGEIVAKGNNHQILANIVETPERSKEKEYKYIYTFSGSFGAIKTFSNFLKLLSMLFADFKYEGKKVEEKKNGTE